MTISGAANLVADKFNQLSSEAASQMSDLKKWTTTGFNKAKGNLDLDWQQKQDLSDSLEGRHFEDDYWKEFDKKIDRDVEKVNETLNQIFGLGEYGGEEKELRFDSAGRQLDDDGRYLGREDENGNFYHFTKDNPYGGPSIGFSEEFQSPGPSEPTTRLPDGPSLSIGEGMGNKAQYGEGGSKEINEGGSTAKIDNWASAMYDAVGENNLSLFEEFKKAGKAGVTYTRDSLVKGFNKTKQLGKAGIDWIADSFERDPVGTTAKGVAIAVAIGVAIVVGPPILSAAGTIIGGGAALGQAILAPLGLGGLGSLIGGLGAGGVMGGLVGTTLKAIVPWGLQAAGQLWNFNWNITDEQIRQQQEAMKLSLIGQSGGVLGKTLGGVICGGLGVATVGLFNKQAAAQILATLGPEVGGEIFEEWAAFLKTGWQLAVQSLALSAYSSLRAWIKAWAKNSALKKHFPQMGAIIEKWGEPGSEAWSFAIEWENYLKRLESTNKEAAAFLEEFAEEFGEGCSDSLLALSY